MKNVELKTDTQAKEEIIASTWSVKGVKFGPGHDGPSMECSVYRDGKRVAKVWDDSWGGGFQFTWLKGKEKVEKELDEFAKSFTCTCKSLGGRSLQYNMDIVVDVLVKDFEETKWFKRNCKNKTAFYLNDSDEIWTIDAPYEKRVKDFLEEKHGKNLKEIVNERFI